MRSRGLETSTTGANFQLAQSDLRLLSAICTEPLGSYKRLAEMTDVSVQTLKRRLLQLSNASMFQAVWARVTYSTLDMQAVPVLTSVSVKNIPLVEEACDAHPYTRYRVRCLGSTNGLFMLFAIPTGTEFQLVEFFEALKGFGIVERYTIIHTNAETTYTNPDLNYYDLETDIWRVKIKTWAKSLESEEGELQSFAQSYLNKLDMNDIKLIHSLTVDARKPQKAVASELRIPEYNLSRRLKFLFENKVVSNFEAVLGRKLFRIGPLVFFHASCSTRTTRAVSTAIRKLPFQSWLFSTNEGFLLFTGIPTSLFTEIGTAILQNSDSLDVMWADYDTSWRYYFGLEPAYDERSKSWGTTREFTIEEPLAELKKAMVK